MNPTTPKMITTRQTMIPTIRPVRFFGDGGGET